MKFTQLTIPGVWRIDIEPTSDARGEFARVFCAEEFQRHGLASSMCQASISTNYKRGTLRGMHYRDASHGEAKLIRCIHGKAFDVALDLRPESPTYLSWAAIEISAAERNAIYIPPGCAHGFISLTDNTELHYMMSVPFVPGSEQGVRWNDPVVGISWPLEPTVISERDKAFPLLARKKS